MEVPFSTIGPLRSQWVNFYNNLSWLAGLALLKEQAELLKKNGWELIFVKIFGVGCGGVGILCNFEVLKK